MYDKKFKTGYIGIGPAYQVFDKPLCKCISDCEELLNLNGCFDFKWFSYGENKECVFKYDPKFLDVDKMNEYLEFYTLEDNDD